MAGLRVGKDLVSDAEIDVGDAVHVAVREGSVVATPIRRVCGSLDLRRLMAFARKDCQRGEIDGVDRPAGTSGRWRPM